MLGMLVFTERKVLPWPPCSHPRSGPAWSWRRVDGGGKGMDEVKARVPEGACVTAKQGQHQRFLGVQNLQPHEGDEAGDDHQNAQPQQDAAKNTVPGIQKPAAQRNQRNGCRQIESPANSMGIPLRAFKTFSFMSASSFLMSL